MISTYNQKELESAMLLLLGLGEVMVSRSLFYDILERIYRLKPVPIGYD